MRDDDEADARLGGRMAEELLQGFQPSGRSADGDDGKSRRLRGVAVFAGILRCRLGLLGGRLSWRPALRPPRKGGSLLVPSGGHPKFSPAANAKCR